MKSTLLCDTLQRNRKLFPFLRPRDPKECRMSARDAAIALRRFGLGARSGEIRRIAGDPRGFLLQSLARADAATISDAALEPSHVTFATALTAQRQKKQAERAEVMRSAEAADVQAAKEPQPQPELQTPPTETAPNMAQLSATPPVERPGRIRREAFQQEAFARFNHAAATDAAFVERLVMFWSNHFCVSANKGPVRGIAGAYRARGDPPARAGPFRRHADRSRAASSHVDLSRQRAIDRSQQPGRTQPWAGPEREPGARNPGIAHAGRRRRLHAG